MQNREEKGRKYVVQLVDASLAFHDDDVIWLISSFFFETRAHDRIFKSENVLALPPTPDSLIFPERYPWSLVSYVYTYLAISFVFTTRINLKFFSLQRDAHGSMKHCASPASKTGNGTLSYRCIMIFLIVHYLSIYLYIYICIFFLGLLSWEMIFCVYTFMSMPVGYILKINVSDQGQ